MLNEDNDFDAVVETLKDLESKWPSSLVPRERISEFTGGLINARTMANLDSMGQGPAKRMRIGRKVVYSVDSVLDWIKNRTESLQD